MCSSRSWCLLLYTFFLLTATTSAFVQRSAKKFHRDASAGSNHVFYEKNCTLDHKQTLIDTFDDAQSLANAEKDAWLKHDFNMSMSQWFGSSWNQTNSKRDVPDVDEGLQLYAPPYEDVILGTMARIDAYFRNQPSKSNPAYKVYFYCHDYSSKCKTTVGLPAYSWSLDGGDSSDHHTVFCPDFFGKPILEDVMLSQLLNPSARNVMENFETNRARIMFHETLHYKSLINNIAKMTDFNWGANGSMALSIEMGTDYAYSNPDTYAMHALAMYVQNSYTLPFPPMPWSQLLPKDRNGSEPSPDKTSYITIKEQPGDWNGPNAGNAIGNPDLFDPMDQLVSNPKPSIKPTTTSTAATPSMTTATYHCAETAHPWFWMGRDALARDIVDFCNDAETQGHADENTHGIFRRYAKGTGDDVKISIEWHKGVKPPDKFFCLGFLNTIMDDCDGNDGLNNSLEKKHEGTLEILDQFYSIWPQSTR